MPPFIAVGLLATIVGAGVTAVYGAPEAYEYGADVARRAALVAADVITLNGASRPVPDGGPSSYAGVASATTQTGASAGRHLPASTGHRV
jgi:hypothetical protein